MSIRARALQCVLITTLVCSLSAAAFAANTVDPATGATMKNGEVVSVPGIDANSLLQKISENKGKVVLVNIFASWCHPCVEEAPSLVALRKQFSEDQLVMIGISVDKTSPALHTFMAKIGFNYPIFVAQGNFEETVGVTAIPQMLIYTKKGELHLNQKGLMPANNLSSLVKKLVSK